MPSVSAVAVGTVSARSLAWLKLASRDVEEVEVGLSSHDLGGVGREGGVLASVASVATMSLSNFSFSSSPSPVARPATALGLIPRRDKRALA